MAATRPDHERDDDGSCPTPHVPDGIGAPTAVREPA